MKLVGGNWFPDHERHMAEWMQAPKNQIIIEGRQTYQWRKQVAALEHVKQWRVAVDIGAHVGLWSWNLAKRFARVEAFEPVAEHRACFELNVEGNIALHPVALGAAPGRIAMYTEEGSSGNSHIKAGAGDIEMRTLDSFDLKDVDFIKIDTEGEEYEIVLGAADTIARCKPIMIVEQKPRVLKYRGIKGTPALDLLMKMGAVQLMHYSGDYIMGWGH